MPGKAYASLQNPSMYEALKRQGMSKQSAARISNARTPGHHVKKHKRGGLHRLIAKERSMEHGPKTSREKALERRISERTGKRYVGRR